jgi:hypothetical protein
LDNVGIGLNVNSGTVILGKSSVAGTGAGGVHAVGAGVNINGGILQLGGSGGDQIYNTAAVTIAGGGRFNTAGLSEGTAPVPSTNTNGMVGMGALTLQSTSNSSYAVIDFGAGANGSSLVFSSLAGGNGAYVNVLNWSGLAMTDNGTGTNDRLLFAADPGLSTAQLANWQFYNDSGSAFAMGAMIIGYGNQFELVPVPEPSTWLAGALVASAVTYSQRRRFARVLRRRAKNTSSRNAGGTS